MMTEHVQMYLQRKVRWRTTKALSKSPKQLQFPRVAGLVCSSQTFQLYKKTDDTKFVSSSGALPYRSLDSNTKPDTHD